MEWLPDITLEAEAKDGIHHQLIQLINHHGLWGSRKNVRTTITQGGLSLHPQTRGMDVIVSLSAESKAILNPGIFFIRSACLPASGKEGADSVGESDTGSQKGPVLS